ncbi:hypothetical protein OUZ56_017678 [Daphnia magna]|uniref:Uncharacterized protein n=1 Tax=Daphnia magna TaxID=35525 RepID=A0ABR0ATE6_9CRUS|nr:hypothetical protein OUZ56_017678 [Daphnia magna]
MIADLPQPEAGIKTSLFTDDIETHVTTNNNRQAETVLQPYLDKRDRWTKHWKLSPQMRSCYFHKENKRRTGAKPTHQQRTHQTTVKLIRSYSQAIFQVRSEILFVISLLISKML